MKLDISRKVATSLKQRESSLISIFKSCFYERNATGTQTSQKINSQKKSSVRRLFIFWNWLSVYQLAPGSIVVHQCILSRHEIWCKNIITQQGRLRWCQCKGTGQKLLGGLLAIDIDKIGCLEPFLPLWEHFWNRVSVELNYASDLTPRHIDEVLTVFVINPSQPNCPWTGRENSTAPLWWIFFGLPFVALLGINNLTHHTLTVFKSIGKTIRDNRMVYHELKSLTRVTFRAFCEH